MEAVEKQLSQTRQDSWTLYLKPKPSSIWLKSLQKRLRNTGKFQWIMIYRISSNNSHPSINCLPRIIAPCTPLFLLFPACQVEEESASKTDQWQSKLWKLIREPNLEHLIRALDLFSARLSNNHLPSNNRPIWYEKRNNYPGYLVLFEEIQ